MGDAKLSDKPLDEQLSMNPTCGKDHEIMEELMNCLPKWVTEEQVTDMIRGTWMNIVEIVDNFYEHETKFYEQVSSVISLTSNHEGFVSKLEFIHCETERKESCHSLQFHKLKSSSSLKKSVSPMKRKRNNKVKTKKKGKGCSKVESVGPKQASITKFFNKVV